MATAWELAICCTTQSQHTSHQKLQACGQCQSGQDIKDCPEPETFPKLLYIQVCGELAGVILKSVSCDALPEASAAAALVSSLDPCLSQTVFCTCLHYVIEREREREHLFHGGGLVQVKACEVALRLGSMPSARDQSTAGQGFDQLLHDSILQASWACSASLVCAVADKLRSCVEQVTIASCTMHHTQQPCQPWRLSSRSTRQHRMGFDHVGSALEVLSHAWEVLSADDALIAAAVQHSTTLLSSVKRWLSPDTQRKQYLDAHTVTVLLHMYAASEGLQVCCMCGCRE